MSQDNKSFKHGNAFETLLCGGLAGTVAKTIIAPFDRVKIHFQVHNPALKNYSGRLSGVFHAAQTIYTASGIQGLYRGHSAMVLRIFPYAAINFYTYERMKRILYQEKRAEQVSWWRRIAAGSISGIVAVTFTYPLDIIRTRLAYDLSKNQSIRNLKSSQKYRNAISGLFKDGKLLFDSKPRGIYQGYIATIVGIVPYAGISFTSFEVFKNLYRHHVSNNHEHIPVLAKLCAGMLAGALAQTAAYPLDVVRHRMQLLLVAPHLEHAHGSRPSMVSILWQILRDDGLKGLFRGLSINYLKVAPATGVSFVVYEFLRESVFKLPERA